MGVLNRSTGLPSATAAPRRMGPNDSSTASFATKVWTSVGKRRKPSEGSRVDGAALVPVPSDYSAHQAYYDTERRQLHPPPPSQDVGERHRRLAPGGCPPGAGGGQHRRRGVVAAQPREEFLPALRVGVAH